MTHFFYYCYRIPSLRVHPLFFLWNWQIFSFRSGFQIFCSKGEFRLNRYLHFLRTLHAIRSSLFAQILHGWGSKFGNYLRSNRVRIHKICSGFNRIIIKAISKSLSGEMSSFQREQMVWNTKLKLMKGKRPLNRSSSSPLARFSRRRFWQILSLTTFASSSHHQEPCNYCRNLQTHTSHWKNNSSIWTTPHFAASSSPSHWFTAADFRKLDFRFQGCPICTFLLDHSPARFNSIHGLLLFHTWETPVSLWKKKSFLPSFSGWQKCNSAAVLLWHINCVQQAVIWEMKQCRRRHFQMGWKVG